MTDKEYMEIDKLDQLEDTLLALASYDWIFFHDTRVFGLKCDYKVSASVSDIFNYYHGKNPDAVRLNHERYGKMYSTYLSAMVYS